jgi:N-acetylglucosaminyldiphosphoundecaprenol N-acetyl-beta-D-mannosaminyltransferase
MDEKYILGVKVNKGLTMSDVLNRVQVLLSDDKCHYIATTNAEFVMEAQKDNEFKDIINCADISVPDGAGVLYAMYYSHFVSKFNKNILFPIRAFLYGIYLGFTSLTSKYQFGERISGVELMHELCKYASVHNKTVALIGGWPKDKWGRKISDVSNVAEIAASKLREEFPGLNVVSAISHFKHISEDDSATLDVLHNSMKSQGISHIDFVFVAYGHPKQEKWIVRNKCKIPAKVCMGVGGSLDYFANIQKRSPEFFINMNLEWMYKLVTQPWRIKRIVRAFPIFPFYVFLNTIKNS